MRDGEGGGGVTADGLAVEFTELSMEVGDHVSGKSKDGRRVVAEVTRVSWWLAPAMWALRIVKAPRAAVWAVQHGMDMKIRFIEGGAE